MQTYHATKMPKRPVLCYLLDYRPLGTRTFDDYLLELGQRCRDRGWRLVCIFSGEPEPRFVERLREVGGEYSVIPMPLSARSTWRLAIHLWRLQPTVLLASFLSPFTPPLLLMKVLGLTRRLVMIDHSSGATSKKTGLRLFLAKLRGRIVGSLVDRIITVSDFNAHRDIHEAFLPARKVQRIYNGIRLDRYAPGHTRGLQPVTQLAYVGQLIPQKGVRTLLDAMRRLAEDGGREIELTIAGCGCQEGELREYCRAAGLRQVQFVGHISWVAELLASADVVVVPSEWDEAFGLVAAEAMACETPVIVSNAGGLPEVVGDSGLVFQRGNPEDLAAKIRLLVESPSLRQTLGRRARQRVEELFTLGRRVRDLLAALQEYFVC